ncbi:MAG TPA: hypothetical protein VEW93_11720 [Acidimicrobiales bacterium]|nr:hypothetical protein [Acidimicrobiales bacterium]
MTAVPPGPPPDPPDGPPPGPPDGLAAAATAGDGGWAATASQGLVLARWVAAEVAAQRLEGFAVVAWIVGLAGLAVGLAGILFWPLVVLGVLVVLAAVAGRLALAAGAWALRRLALPRRARHLRAEAAAARGRLKEALAAAGVPVSLRAALRFVVALARGRRPQAGVATNLRALSGRLGEVAEIERLRRSLADAAPPPAWLARRPDGDASPPPGP